MCLHERVAWPSKLAPAAALLQRGTLDAYAQREVRDDKERKQDDAHVQERGATAAATAATEVQNVDGAVPATGDGQLADDGDARRRQVVQAVRGAHAPEVGQGVDALAAGDERGGRPLPPHVHAHRADWLLVGLDLAELRAVRREDGDVAGVPGAKVARDDQGRRAARSVRDELHGLDREHLAGLGILESKGLLPRGCVPKPAGPATVAGGHHLAVGAEVQVQNLLLLCARLLQRRRLPHPREAPDPHDAVGATGGHCVAGRAGPGHVQLRCPAFTLTGPLAQLCRRACILCELEDLDPGLRAREPEARGHGVGEVDHDALLRVQRGHGADLARGLVVSVHLHLVRHLLGGGGAAAAAREEGLLAVAREAQDGHGLGRIVVLCATPG
mmetsp:Transcript_17375/g.54976  ORF Transcript_17375/g.54976 Transcript_17375/m.54976 type:complete len:387 (+) Transcript_17375:200-1360(+)